jgi:hypothetical protein
MELFPAEQYDELVSGLRRLFPAQRYGRDEIDRLGVTVARLFEGGWSSIGVLRRDKSWPGPQPTRLVPELPEQVHSVEVGVHKILPSAVVVAFDVSLTEAATKELKALHNRKYLPSARFHGWAPWRQHSWGLSESPAEWAMQEAIRGWEWSLHSGVERVIRPYLSGFFSHSVSGGRRLLAIDLFTVFGIPEIEDAGKRLQGFSLWMESLSLHSRPGFDNFLGKDLMFSWSEDRDEGLPLPYRFIDIHFEQAGDENSKVHRHFELKERLDAVLPYVCLLEAISRVRLQVEQLRVRVYRTLARRDGLLPGFRRDMKLNDRVQKEEMFVSRLSLELEDAKPWLEREIRILGDLVQPAMHAAAGGYCMADALSRSLSFHLDRVSKHIDLVARSFTDYVSRRNLAVMYRLQIQVLVLTIVATLAAILGVLATWPQIREIFRGILKQ